MVNCLLENIRKKGESFYETGKKAYGIAACTAAFGHGDPVKIQLRTDNSGTEWGFKVSSITGVTNTDGWVLENGNCTNK